MTRIPPSALQTLAPIILASQSPRRRQLLAEAGVSFTVVPSSIREEDFAHGDPPDYARDLAQAKALEVARRHPQSWVIGADSIVAMDGRILEKPPDRPAAREMLERLQGRTHRVFTGFSIIHEATGHGFSDVAMTEVRFKPLTDEEIDWYIHTPEPYDKAGGYAIQGLGAFMVLAIRGSYTNVVGLPVCEVLDHLCRMGVIARRGPCAGKRKDQP